MSDLSESLRSVRRQLEYASSKLSELREHPHASMALSYVESAKRELSNLEASARAVTARWDWDDA